MKDLKVLVAEDEAIVAMSLTSQLHEIGLTVAGVAADGVEAVDLCQKIKPDLVIMDINMPRLSGIHAAWMIKERYQIPVVIVSGYSDEILIKEAMEAGVLNYLVKPVTKYNLAPAIEIALKNYHQFFEMNEETNRLKRRLEERKTIEKAKGLLMQHKRITEFEAMKRLQQLSNNKNVKLVEVAKEVIAAYQLLDS